MHLYPTHPWCGQNLSITSDANNWIIYFLFEKETKKEQRRVHVAGSLTSFGGYMHVSVLFLKKQEEDILPLI